MWLEICSINFKHFVSDYFEALCKAAGKPLQGISLVIKWKTFTFNKILSSVQLAQFRQRKAQTDGQNASKKQKKKRKTASIKDEESIQDGIDIDRSRGDETSTCSSRRGAAATAEFAVMRTLHSGEIITHSQTYTTEVSLSQVANCKLKFGLKIIY